MLAIVNFAEFFFHVVADKPLCATPIGQGRRRGDAHIVGYYVSYVQVWQALGPSVHKKALAASGRGKRRPHQEAPQRGQEHYKGQSPEGPRPESSKRLE